MTIIDANAPAVKAKRNMIAADISAPEQLVIDLFDRGAPIYPAFPGSKGGETSREAAESIAPFASNKRGQIARLMADNWPRGFTPDEAANELNATPFMIRPRFTELSNAGLIEKTGDRRRNPNSTLSAAVWRASALLLRNGSAPSIAPAAGIDGGCR
jgi:hypothetical protein